jgi:hypothetical protein
MNEKEQLSFIDLLSILSFCIGVMNLDLNVSAEDIDNQTQTLLNEIHGHLKTQDNKLDNIIERLEKLEDEKQGRKDEALYDR